MGLFKKTVKLAFAMAVVGLIGYGIARGMGRLASERRARVEADIEGTDIREPGDYRTIYGL